MVKTTDSETVCESPICDGSFPKSGMAISPKRFCRDECKMNAWILKRASKLLEGLTDEEKLKVLRSR
jgi:hypothetical protein